MNPVHVDALLEEASSCWDSAAQIRFSGDGVTPGSLFTDIYARLRPDASFPDTEITSGRVSIKAGHDGDVWMTEDLSERSWKGPRGYRCWLRVRDVWIGSETWQDALADHLRVSHGEATPEVRAAIREAAQQRGWRVVTPSR